MRRAALAALLAALTLPGAAQAASAPPEAYLPQARAYWGADVPCVRVEWGDLTGEAAHAELGGCVITVDRATWARESREKNCDTIAHEFGHLPGRGHRQDGSLMDPLRIGIIAQCRPPRKGRAFRAVRAARRFRLARYGGHYFKVAR